VTDAGERTNTIREHITGSDIVFLVCFHDVDMLKNGKYPQVLKRRILGSHGHLSNKAAGMLLTETATKKMRYVFLGHLSEQNNRPLIAYGTVERILYDQGVLPEVGLKLIIAQRYGLSTLVEL
jgi:phosphoribosyl 1,2-cyclic phosphodiesterase